MYSLILQYKILISKIIFSLWSLKNKTKKYKLEEYKQANENALQYHHLEIATISFLV